MKVHKAFYNLGAASVSRLGSAALTFALFWWLARSLPPAELGAFALIMSVFGLLQLMPLLGLHVPLAREVALDPARLRDCVHEHIWFALPVAVAIGAVLCGYPFIAHGDALVWPFVLLAAAMLPTAWTTVAEATLIGLERMRSIASINLFEALLRLVGSGVALALGGSLTAVMAVFLVGRCISALLYLRLPDLPRPQLLRPPGADRWRTMGRNVPVFLGIVTLAALSSRLDVLALSHLVSLDALGQYAAGVKLYEAAMMVPSLATMVILPPLARLFKEDRSAFKAMLPKAIRGLLAIGLPIAIVGAACAPQAVALLYPTRFTGAAPVVQALLFAAVFATIDLLLSSVMLASHAQRQDLQSLVAGLVTLAVLIFLLVPRIGPVGAAVAVTLHMLVRVLWRARWFAAVFEPTKFWRLFAGAALAGTAGVAVLIATGSFGAPVAALAALAAYLVAAFAGGLLRFADFAVLNRLVPRRRLRGT